MSLWLGLRRISQSLNTLMRHRSLAHRHFAAQSCSRRVLFHAKRVGEQCFYSAKIEKNGTLGPATMLPPIPHEIIPGTYFSWSRNPVLNGKIVLRLGSQYHLCSPDTGEYSTLPDVPPLAFPVERGQYDDFCYFWFDTLSNEYKVLFVQEVRQSQNSLKLKRLFWVLTQGSGSWSQIHPFLPEQIFRFPNDVGEVVFANGAFHWICVLSSRRGPSTKTEEYILAFDMVEGLFRKIPYPDDSFPGKLTQFGGRLALIEKFPLWFGLQEGPDDLEYDKLQLWILEDYNNHEWVKETIHLPFDWRMNKVLLAFNYNTGEMLLLDGEYLLYYNTKTGTFRTAEVTGLPQWTEDDHLDFHVVDVNFDDEMERQNSF